MTHSRREFLRALAGSAVAVGCGSLADGGAESARLTARPGTPTGSVSPGTIELGLEQIRRALLVVPSSYDPSVGAPLVVALHGAGGSAQGPVNFLGTYAEAHGFLLLAVDSLGPTWDVMYGPYGPDVTFLDRALRETFTRCRVQPSRVVLEGFSDGATYALGLGPANGDLFSRVVSFSPGFIPPETPRLGKPAIFVSHGRQDPVLSFANTQDVIVPALESAGYAVTFVAYEGVHAVPPDVAETAVTWLLG